MNGSDEAGAGAAGARRPRDTIRHRLVVVVALLFLGPVLWLGPLAGPSRAAVTVDLDQWASLEVAWQNGNLNGNNSRYPEGGVVPFRLALEGLAAGNHEIRISYDFTAGGHKAYDFLATWNATSAGGAICLPSGGAISSMCPSLPPGSTFPLPSDPYKTDGLTVNGAQAYAGMPRRMSIWGGTVLSITSPVHTGSASGNSDVEIIVRFKASASAVLLAWGGHLAQSSYWNSAGGGERDGASLVSGAPWHVRTLGLDGAGSKNQDRSIQPSAIVGELPPGGNTAPTPQPTQPPGQPPGQPPAGAGPGLTPPDTAAFPPSGARAAPNAAELGALALLAALCLVVLARGSPARRRP